VAARLRAPELVGRGGWHGTGGRALSLADLRGRFVLLDFWTSCCVNCLHVLEELRPLEERWADVLTVVGVHSPKFPHEAAPGAVAAAVGRLGITHPVLDDPDLRTWTAYTATAWPTLVLVDPEGRIAATFTGEGHGHAIDALLGTLVPQYAAAGSLVVGPGPHEAAAEPSERPLRFPGGLALLPDGRRVVADTGRHRLVVLDAAGDVLAVLGTGERGHRDGPAAEAAFAEPQGLCAVPPGLVAAWGVELVVADTANHAVRGVCLEAGEVVTLAEGLSSAWDVERWRGLLWVAAAGTHQVVALDPAGWRPVVVVGTGVEGLRDGPAHDAWCAQPSGLAAAGDVLWIADAETSALRRLEPADDGYRLTTSIGTGLFDWGFCDGPGGEARLQHPLGVAALPDGAVAVCDTYNGAVRRYDPQADRLVTLAAGLGEPVAAVSIDGGLLVVASAEHRLVLLDPAARTPAPDERGRPVRIPTALAPGTVELVVSFAPPPGQRLDNRGGAATRLTVSATPAALLREGNGDEPGLTRRLVLDADVGDGVLHIVARAATCDADPDVSGAACHRHQQDWGLPVVVVPGAQSILTLPLGGAS
jgi:thiol-disulfide isomerase/thioredoxin